MRARAVASCCVLLLGGGFAACAHSTDSTDVAGLPASPLAPDAGDDGAVSDTIQAPSDTDGAAGAPQACAPDAGPPCPAGLVCSAAVCVAAKTDADMDGYTADVDCDDHDPTVHPGAPHRCDGKDDACDGKVNAVPALLVGSLTTPINTHWSAAGAAVIASGWGQLTPDTITTAGALWWNAPYTFDTFDVTATIWIQPKSGGADGIAFGWVPGNDVTKVGQVGPGFGIQGLGGYAVAVKTFQNPGEPPVPFLALVDETSGGHIARAAIPATVHDGNTHTLRVTLDGGAVSVWFDAINYMNLVAIPGYVPFAGHWGFGGGTGAYSEEQWVKDITMSFPNGQGCVP